MRDEEKLDRTATTKDGAAAAPTPAAGTTHDPNSITTGTPQEPARDIYPPKGESE